MEDELKKTALVALVATTEVVEITTQWVDNVAQTYCTMWQEEPYH